MKTGNDTEVEGAAASTEKPTPVAERESMRVWEVKCPKTVGGKIAAVLYQDTNELVLTHTTAGGKVITYAKVA